MNRYWILSLSLCAILAAHPTGAQEQGKPSGPDYTVLPGDTLQISVWQEDELQREVLVRPDGWFSFPLAGDVRAVGRTVSEIEAEILQSLMRYIPDAVLTVSVTGIDGNKVYVLGQVQRPGSFTVNPRVDVTQALSMAGGTTPFAAVNDILVLRRRGGQQSTIEFHYGDIEKGKNLQQNVLLEPGDIVIVP